MKLTQIPKITRKQREILDLIYSHRFLTRIQIQAFLKHKDKKTINLWLKDLRSKNYINWIYDKDNQQLLMHYEKHNILKTICECERWYYIILFLLTLYEIILSKKMLNVMGRID